MPRSALAPLLVAVLAAPLIAHADPKEEAKAHVVKAMDAHEKGDYETAIHELLVAHELDKNPDLLYAIGQVYVKLDRCADAILYYNRYLDTKPPAQATADTKQAITTCEKKLPPPPEPEPTPEPLPPVVVAPAAQGTPWYKDVVGDVLVVSGVASAAVGIVLYSSARSDLDEAESASSLDAYDDLVDGARSKRTYSVLLIGGGALLIGAGVARFLLTDEDAAEKQRVGLVPVDRGGLVTFGGSF